MSHTPGPWRFVEGEFNNAESRDNAIGSVRGGIENDWFIATVEDAPEATANAHLIAAAPELLEALRKCEHWMSSYSPAFSSDSLASARAAIAKAEGRS